MERDCESELSKLNIEQNACIYHFGASVIHGQRSNILRLQQSFDPVPSSSTEQEERTGCRIHLKLVFDNGTETIDRFAHICIAADNVDLFEAGDIT